jgi:hypothetical protein
MKIIYDKKENKLTIDFEGDVILDLKNLELDDYFKVEGIPKENILITNASMINGSKVGLCGNLIRAEYCEIHGNNPIPEVFVKEGIGDEA